MSSQITKMKIGDVIARKDMPSLPYRIIGEHKEWDAWIVNNLRVDLPKNVVISKGLVWKDDNRWEIVKK